MLVKWCYEHNGKMVTGFATYPSKFAVDFLIKRAAESLKEMNYIETELPQGRASWDDVELWRNSFHILNIPEKEYASIVKTIGAEIGIGNPLSAH